MKKLKLRLANVQGENVLGREQLKKIVGGETGSASHFQCTCDDGSTFGLAVTDSSQILTAIERKCNGGGGSCENTD